MCRLRVDQQAGRRREGGTLGRVGKPGDAEGPANPYWAPQDVRREIGDAGELARAAGQHNARTRFGREG